MKIIIQSSIEKGFEIKKIGYCSACCYCHTSGGVCAKKDNKCIKDFEFFITYDFNGF